MRFPLFGGNGDARRAIDVARNDSAVGERPREVLAEEVLGTGWGLEGEAVARCEDMSIERVSE